MEEPDAVRDLAGEAHLVGREQHGHALGLQVANRGQHLADQLGVERARDLVEQHRPRPRGEGAGDRHPLLLAAGEPVGRVLLAPGEPEAGEQRPGRLIGLLARDVVALLDPEQDVVDHVQVREEVVGLEHEREPAANRHGLDRRVGDHLPVEEDVAVVDVLQQVDAAQDRGLARAGGADQRHGLVLVNGQVDAVEHLPVAERLGDPGQLEHGGPLTSRVALPRSQRSSRRAIGIVMHR